MNPVVTCVSVPRMALALTVKGSGRWIKIGDVYIHVRRRGETDIRVAIVAPKHIHIDRDSEPPEGYEELDPKIHVESNKFP